MLGQRVGEESDGRPGCGSAAAAHAPGAERRVLRNHPSDVHRVERDPVHPDAHGPRPWNRKYLPGRRGPHLETGSEPERSGHRGNGSGGG